LSGSGSESAAILGLSTKVVRMPLAEPVRTAIHDARDMDHVLVRLFVEGGVTGVGHVFAFGQGWASALEAMVRQLAGGLVGMNAADPPAVHDAMQRSIRFMGVNGAAQMAVAALDTACWDILGRLRREPLWSLLGGRRRQLPCYASDSLWLGDPVEHLPGQALRRLDQGFTAVKVRIGSAQASADEVRLAAVREAIGPDTTLMADVNQGWNRDQALESAGWLRKYGLYWLEEPVVAEDYESLRAVGQGAGIPIATGESWFGMHEVDGGLATGVVSTLMPDLQRMGGVTGWMRAAEAARRTSTRVSPHLFPEVSVHLMCALDEDHFIEWVPWFQELFDVAPVVSEGRLQPGDEPGLGLRFREEVFPE
jgi:L-alanine-DL-glutamate epimerase-like enolase superfamily enzyme